MVPASFHHHQHHQEGGGIAPACFDHPESRPPVVGEELKPLLGPEPQVDPEVEQEGHADPNTGPDESLSNANLVRLAMKDAEVQDQHGHHEHGEPEPQNRGADAV